MRLIDRGSGPPIVLVPGVQGRWEWMRPTVAALERRCRVITFSLADEPTAGAPRGAPGDFAEYVDQIASALDAAGLPQAAICGVSYGGLIAAAFAARYPHRVSALVLVSALPPGWRPDARARFYLRAPRLLAPLFCVESLRLYREIAAAHGGHARGLVAAARHVATVLRYPFSPARMAQRVRQLERVALDAALRRVEVPTLVVTGEDALDRIVPVHRTREYLRWWPHARSAVLPRTGHLGFIMRPEAFADLVVPFVVDADRPQARRQHAG